MEIIYPYVHLIHLFLAIMFLGYVFTDLALISKLKGKFSKETQEEMAKILGKRSFHIFPLSLLFLVFTGGIMLSHYMNFDAGFLQTPLQKVLALKVFFVSIIVVGVLSNVYKKFTNKKKSNFMQYHFHKLVITMGIFIVICAKWMFLV